MAKKNPWMSLWLSEANRAAGPMRGAMSAEISRQQQQMMKAWTKQASSTWMAMCAPWTAPMGKGGSRGRKGRS